MTAAVVIEYPVDGKMLKASYLPHELVFMKSLKELALSTTDPRQRTEVLNEIAVIHAFKAQLDATIVEEDSVGTTAGTVESVAVQLGMEEAPEAAALAPTNETMKRPF